MNYLDIFKKTSALLEGHFLLTSGRHSDRFIQCAQALQYPDHTETLCRALAEKFLNQGITTVIGPAIGGIIVAYETARHLDSKAVFAEKQDGKLVLGRGFELGRGEKVLVVEDVTTTGGSVKKVVDIVVKHGADPVAVAVLVDRSGGNIDFGVPFESLVSIKVDSYGPEDCPLCKQNKPVTDPDFRRAK
jgi:orotate phosphoribosyltransferase